MLLNLRNLQLPGSRKLAPRWVGPFTIVRRIGETAYELDLKQKYARLHPVFHVSLLKRHQAGGASPAPPDPIEVDGLQEFEVERILGHRQLRNKTQYLVRWRGYDASEDQWLSEDALANAQAILTQYKSSAGLP